MLIDHRRIGELIPHAGTMCLLATAEQCDDETILCTATSHRDARNPLRRGDGLYAVCALEYAAQAMALHGALTAPGSTRGALTAPDARRSRGGLLAVARDLVLHRERLDDCGELLTIEARRVMGEANRVIYEFRVADAGKPVAQGRAAVVLDASAPG